MRKKKTKKRKLLVPNDADKSLGAETDGSEVQEHAAENITEKKKLKQQIANIIELGEKVSAQEVLEALTKATLIIFGKEDPKLLSLLYKLEFKSDDEIENQGKPNLFLFFYYITKIF